MGLMIAARPFNLPPLMSHPPSARAAAFTLIELLVVIAIIAVLMGLAFPAYQKVQDSAKRVSAKNDITQIVTAVNAFYTEYGQYPCGAQSGADAMDYYTGNNTDKKNLFDALRVPFPSTPPALNPRGIVFLQPAGVKSDVAGQRRSGIGGDGVYYDPWGGTYRVKMDNNYNGLLTNPYDANTGAGFGSVNLGVMALSPGKDKKGPDDGGEKNYKKSDDVISWQ